MSAEAQFNKGDRVEVLMRDNFPIWFPAAVLRPSVRKNQRAGQIYVEFETLCSDDDPMKRRKEYVHLSAVRPAPPGEPCCYFRVGESADVFYENRGWRRGTVDEILENSMYMVALGDEDAVESVKVEQWQLRVHRDWKDGCWVPPLEESQVDQQYQQKKSEDFLMTPSGVKLRIKCTRGSCVRKFSKEMPVEVKGDKEGFERSWYASVVMEVLGNGKLLVQYQDLKTDDGTDYLIEEVDASCIRPCPPEIHRISPFKLLDKVDAWVGNGWWEGHVSKVLGDAKYMVCFGSMNELLTFEASDLRPHQEWKNNNWVAATKIDLPRSSSDVMLNSKVVKVKSKSDRKALGPKFSKGMLVEATSFEEGYHGSWYTAVIFDSIGPNKFLLEYQTLRTDDESEPLKEKADAFNIRPCPPLIHRFDRFKMFEEVDAWYNEGWWEGLISKVLDGLNYVVYFWTTNEEIEFAHHGIRPHQEWIDKKWDIAFRKSNNNLPNPKPGIMRRHSGGIASETTFCIGAKVEVKDDEEGNQGSWYPALILRLIGNGKYLVEFRTLKCDFGTDLLVQEADALSVRPSAPILQRVDRFRPLEEVDAWSNNGWRVGQVCEVLEGAKYRVNFRTTNEILEFRHHGLRLHQEWINGAWVVGVKEA
ncbi:PREDICTED: uncharacterized protein LOC109169756 isoform X2 [Ipomoea nil]|uniref:uncharacterized protein LOC109169756 isoform X2 n=1 Tax=Ipomoea nil TaxID=35883 RepID=UPI0009011A4F|nr:PREDICTED: uncharacterized protein LOC109169756 isoform X2 [Ipomoea nil]